MSGKLKLLPHKSWNVWNRDNREKVLKDKRLLEEENDIKSKREKELEQEHILNVLKSTSSNGKTNNTGIPSSNALVTINDNNNDNSNNNNNNNDSNNNNNNNNNNDKQVQVFRLFDDVEEKLQKQRQNDEYKREKEMKELLKQRKEGTAPWGLADGIHEKSKIKPWYIRNETPETAIEKDADDKSRLDPMARFIVRDKYEYDYHHHVPTTTNATTTNASSNNRNNNNNNDSRKPVIHILANMNTIMGLSNSKNDDKNEKKHKKKRKKDDDDSNSDDKHKHKMTKHKKDKKSHKHQ